MLLSFGSFSQTSTVDITSMKGERKAGTYYKDTHNYLNPFEGTWRYTNGTTSIKIVLVKKKTHNSGYDEDKIVGEYQYIENGVEKINTLSDINTVYPNQIQHTINGNTLINPTSRPVCTNCAAGEKRLRLSLSETGSFGSMVARKVVENGQEAIQIRLGRHNGIAIVEGTTPPPEVPVLPSGEYVLIKQ